MPVIVVGADTAAGRAVVDELRDPRREIRVFVSDVEQAKVFRDLGLKVALGDVSDESHVEASATRCFTAVLVAEAAADARERAFADDLEQVLAGWARAVGRAAVKRVIWVGDLEPPPADVPEVTAVSTGDPRLGRRVAELDEAQRIL